MRIELGGAVRSKDGHRVGEITRVIWDPDRNEIGEFLLTTGGLLKHDVLISREVLEGATGEDGELVVDLTKEELEGLEHYNEKAYAPPPYGFLSPAESTYAGGAYLVPLTKVSADAPPTTGAPDRRRPTIKKGMAVIEGRGSRIGEVHELRIDDMTGELRAIVVAEEGGRATFEIPADQLDVGDDGVHLIEERSRSEATRSPRL
jgi:sporulation protein YlmC with PRC-barrel domain